LRLATKFSASARPSRNEGNGKMAYYMRLFAIPYCGGWVIEDAGEPQNQVIYLTKRLAVRAIRATLGKCKIP
jgi:hypothetical protein